MTRGDKADAATERKPRASTRGAPPPRERRYSSDSAACLFALAPNGSARNTHRAVRRLRMCFSRAHKML